MFKRRIEHWMLVLEIKNTYDEDRLTIEAHPYRFHHLRIDLFTWVHLGERCITWRALPCGLYLVAYGLSPLYYGWSPSPIYMKGGECLYTKCFHCYIFIIVLE